MPKCDFNKIVLHKKKPSYKKLLIRTRMESAASAYKTLTYMLMIIILIMNIVRGSYHC